MAFTCPRCGRTSHGPDDERHGYCGACHCDFAPGTWPPQSYAELEEAARLSPLRFSPAGQDGEYACRACGRLVAVPPFHAGAVWCPCGSPEPMTGAAPPEPPCTGYAEAGGVPVRLVTSPEQRPGYVTLTVSLDGITLCARTAAELAAALQALRERWAVPAAGDGMSQGFGCDSFGNWFFPAGSRLPRDLPAPRAQDPAGSLSRGLWQYAESPASATGRPVARNPVADLEAAGRYVRERYGTAQPERARLDQPGLIVPEAAAGPLPQDHSETDVYPWYDAMRCYPGDAES